ncbi:MAG: flagellar basal body P-ring formation protein FlgA [Desulfobacterales bacterium]|uniref:Flagellar basal body P-ring formation protein FlgA n=1 Tax=Candidatus Desulfatibia profunda TaxID=2841695 RepID=A0A8J6NMP6_9BACT|nr:flagellar basal body P-ring formation protein FlgA [Candidatus Desulfatibia profunda]MBL7179791.1 flagellar basal body P-ring formation protein FlgA [Desulfobacterales bacterium]
MVKTARLMIVLLCFLAVCFPAKAETASGKNNQAAELQNSQSIPESEFREAFAQYLCRRLGKAKSDVVVSEFDVDGNKPVPNGTVGFQLFQKGRSRIEGYVRIVALISVNGVVRNKVNLSGRVDVFESVVCTSKNLKRGEAINAGDVYLARKNVSYKPSDYVTDISKVTGLMAKHSIKANTFTKEWMLEKFPVVAKGDLVTILAESSSLRITVPGRILMNGYSGELVKVENLMSKKEIYAKVVNTSTVTVDF